MGKGSKKGASEAGAPKRSKRPKRRRAPLADRLTTLVLVLFLGSLAVPPLVGG